MILVSDILAPMYICVCNGHRERDIREAARRGLRSVSAIYSYLGKPVRCGRCLDHAARVIDEVHAVNGQGRRAAADTAG